MSIISKSLSRKKSFLKRRLRVFVLKEKKNWQVVGTNGVFAPKSKNNSYLIDIRKNVLFLSAYVHQSNNYFCQLLGSTATTKIPTLIHFGSQDLLTIRTRSDLHPFFKVCRNFPIFCMFSMQYQHKGKFGEPSNTFESTTNHRGCNSSSFAHFRCGASKLQ